MATDDQQLSPDHTAASGSGTGRRGAGLWPAGVAVAAIVLAGLVLILRPVAGSHSGDRAGPSVGSNVGQRAPAFTLATLQGKPVSLRDYLGRPVLLHFWAVDCTTCRAEQATYLRAVHALGQKAPAILAVDAWGEPAGYVAPYVKESGLPGTVLIDPPHRVFDSLYHGLGTPTSLFIDAQGVIRQRVLGPQSYEQFLANARLIGA